MSEQDVKKPKICSFNDKYVPEIREVLVNCLYKYLAVFLLQQVLIDGSGHLLGRLASIVAKAILQGKAKMISYRL